MCFRVCRRGKGVLYRSVLAATPAVTVALGAASARAQSGPYGTVTFSALPTSIGSGHGSTATTGYGLTDTNSCAIDLNNIVTEGGYQFIGYYNNNGDLIVGRRATSSGANNTNSWTLVNTDFTAAGGTSDDHDGVSIAIDGNGQMHLSWGMHNNDLAYDISNAAVTGATFAPSFTAQTSTNDPGLFTQITSSGINQITYPQFYNIPNSGNLLFVYRDAASASGGGSGNGNEYFAIYNSTTKTYSAAQNIEVMDGGITSVNGYLNNLAYAPNGTLDMTWTWRATPTWQTNSNLMFAQSPNNGQTWDYQNGSPQYTLPIIQNTSDGGSASQVGQVVYNIPENSSYINQAAEAVDNNGNPMVATYMAPGSDANNPVSPTNNPNLQYVVFYSTGSSWQMSVVSNRTSDTAFDTGGGDVRDVARPDLLVDKSDRIILITRSEDTSMGSYSNPSTPNNDIVAYYTTDAALMAGQPNWRSTVLDTANMGEYEPTYDSALWAASNILNLFYEPEGLSGEGAEAVSVMQWNEAQFFADGISWNNSGGTGDGLTWDNENNVNWNNGTTPVNFMVGDNVNFTDTNNSNYNVTLNSIVQPGAVTVNATGNYSITGSGSISGTAALTKEGAGTLTLGTSNSYSGGTTIVAGSVKATSSGAFGTGSVTIETDDGLELGNGVSVGNTLVLDAGSNEFVNVPDTGASATLSGSISPSGTNAYKLGISGSGATITMTGASNAEGNAAVLTRGNIVFANSGSLTNSAAINIGAFANTSSVNVTVENSASITGTQIDLGGLGGATDDLATSLTLAGNGQLTATGNGAINLDISGTSNSTTTLTLSGNSNLTAGSFTLTSTASGTSANLNFNGGTITASQSNANFLPAFSALTATVQAGGAVFNNNGFNITIGQGIGGSAGDGGFTSNGTGTTTLTGGNSWTGGTNVNAGALVIGAAGALPSGGNVANNASLLVNASSTAGNVSGTGTTTVAGSATLVTANFTQAALVNNGTTQINGSGTVGPISGNGTLILGNGAPSMLQLAHGSGLSTMGSLSIANTSGSALDLANNHIIINYGSNADPATTILSYLSSGANDGGWNGTGLISSTASTNTNYGLAYSDGADGIDPSLTSGEIEVAYAQYGDISLQGVVNAQDFTTLANNFGFPTTSGWEAGDFLYQGVVNAEDFFLLASNFGLTENGEDLGVPAGDRAAILAFASANGLSVPANVPEPASLGLLTVLGAGVMRRRRHAR